jgi:hypothetical protein
MARFLQLSRMLINVDAIRFIFPGIVKAKEGESKFGCTVYFINTVEPYAFYGEDAEKLLNFTKENQFVPQQPQQTR